MTRCGTLWHVMAPYRTTLGRLFFRLIKMVQGRRVYTTYMESSLGVCPETRSVRTLPRTLPRIAVGTTADNDADIAADSASHIATGNATDMSVDIAAAMAVDNRGYCRGHRRGQTRQRIH